MEDLTQIAQDVVTQARSLGADEVRARVSRSVSTELEQRDGTLEKCQESRSLSASAAVLVDDRWSVHATNDLRPEALGAFLKRAIDATRFLQPDPDRRLPDPALMGSADAGALDLYDEGVAAITPGERRVWVGQVEQALGRHASDAPVRSATVYQWDAATERAVVTSNGFSSAYRTTSFGHGGSLTLEDEGGRLPEAYAFFNARHRADLPDVDQVGRLAVERAMRRLGSGPAASGRYPMLLENRMVGRILGVLLGPLSGDALYEQRSCMADKLGERIAATGFSLFDDPLMVRGLGSSPHDSDGLPAVRRDIVRDGVLKTFLLDVYHARRLDTAPTTGGTSNLVVPAGERSPAAIASELPSALRIEGFLGGNSNASTGDFSFGVHGTLLERGEPVKAISEMNVSGNLFDLFDHFVEAADDVWLHGGTRSPTLVFDQVQFSGS